MKHSEERLARDSEVMLSTGHIKRPSNIIPPAVRSSLKMERIGVRKEMYAKGSAMHRQLLPPQTPGAAAAAQTRSRMQADIMIIRSNKKKTPIVESLDKMFSSSGGLLKKGGTPKEAERSLKERKHKKMIKKMAIAQTSKKVGGSISSSSGHLHQRSLSRHKGGEEFESIRESTQMRMALSKDML